jgi:hypothetical protein
MYQPGDYVYPADLPRRVLCRVTEVESGSAPDGTFQILHLHPLEGPWDPGTRLVRLDQGVLPANEEADESLATG